SARKYSEPDLQRRAAREFSRLDAPAAELLFRRRSRQRQRGRNRGVRHHEGSDPVHPHSRQRRRLGQPLIPVFRRRGHGRLDQRHGTPAQPPHPVSAAARAAGSSRRRGRAELRDREADFRKVRDPLMAYPRITIADAGRHAGETVEIPGWLYNLRKSGKIVFPLLRDGTGIMQCVAVKNNLDEKLFESLKELTQESSLIVTGKIRAEQRAPGGYEMDVENAEVVQRVPEAD